MSKVLIKSEYFSETNRSFFTSYYQLVRQYCKRWHRWRVLASLRYYIITKRFRPYT